MEEEIQGLTAENKGYGTFRIELGSTVGKIKDSVNPSVWAILSILVLVMAFMSVTSLASVRVLNH